MICGQKKAENPGRDRQLAAHPTVGGAWTWRSAVQPWSPTLGPGADGESEARASLPSARRAVVSGPGWRPRALLSHSRPDRHPGAGHAHPAPGSAGQAGAGRALGGGVADPGGMSNPWLRAAAAGRERAKCSDGDNWARSVWGRARGREGRGGRSQPG